MSSATAGLPPGPLADPRARRAEQRAWYFYDWANSAFVTTTATVLFGPYLTVIAEIAACGSAGTQNDPCRGMLSVLGIPIAAGSLAPYAVTFATLLSAVLLPVVGALADRTARKRQMMAGFAWLGALAAAAMVFVTGSNWQLGVTLLVIASICLGSSMVVYDAILNQIAAEADRDRVSSRGWALGYLGGGLLLAVNLVIIQLEPFGLDRAGAVRLCLLSAGLWWGLWTIVPYRGIRDRMPLAVVDVSAGNVSAGNVSDAAARGAQPGLARQAFGQLAHTLRHARAYPETLKFLLAYLLYNDGIQTVIYASSIYATRELHLGENNLIIAILIVQFVAVGGALALGRVAGRIGGKHTVLTSLVLWIVVVSAAYFLPVGEFMPFVALAIGIGFVLGGSQALSRSTYSLLIPRGKEAEYFGLYQAAERGTSWFGTLAFGITFQMTGSYRSSILVLLVFFILGFVLLAKVNLRRGITDAGNEVPMVLQRHQ